MALAVLVALPILLTLGGLAALRSAAVRRAVLTELTGYLRREYGLAMEAEDFTARRNGFSIDGLKIGVPGAAPLLTATKVDAKLDVGSLRRPLKIIHELVVDDPRIDLSAPFPTLPESPPPGFEIRRLVVHRGVILGAPPEPPLSEQLTSWQVDEIAAGGSFVDGLWKVKVDSSRVRVERPGFEPLVLQASAQAEYRDGQPVRIAGLKAAGGGLRVTGSGTAGLEGTPLTSLDAVFDVQAEPRVLVVGAPPGGSIHARGNLKLPEAVGVIAVTADDIPAEVARPYLEAGLYQDLSLAGTVAEAKADLVLGPGTLSRVTGAGEATWRRGRQQLVRMDLDVEPGIGDGDAAIVLTAEGDLLPASPGLRHVRGTVEAADWAGLAEATVRKLDAEVKLPDVRAALAEVRALWPRLVPAIPDTIPVRGSLNATARMTGTLDSPFAKADATWLPEAGSRVHLTAEGRPVEKTGTARVEVENLDLALVSPHPPAPSPTSPPPSLGEGEQDRRGRVSGTVDLSGSPRSYRTKVDATVSQATYPPYLDSLEQAKVTAEGALRLEPLRYAGTVNVDGSGLFVRPNASDTARLATFTLATDGTLNLDPLSYQGKIALDGADLEAPGMVLAETFGIDADGLFRTELTPLAATARIEASAVRIATAATTPPELATLLDVRAEVVGEGKQLRIASLSGAMPEGRSFRGSGRVTVEPLLDEADLNLTLVKPVDPVREIELSATLRNGIVELNAPRIDTEAGSASARATVPLGALARIPELTEALSILSTLPVTPAPGEVVVRLEAPAVDSRTLLAALGLEPRDERIQAGVRADLSFDPLTPAAGRGEIRVDRLTFDSKDGHVTAGDTVTLRLAGGKIELAPVRLQIESGEIGATAVDLSGSADLDPAWNPFRDEPKAVVRSVSAQGSGTLDAALLNPFLEGGEAAGALAFKAEANGPIDRLEATFEADGSSATFAFASAGVQIAAPVVSGQLSGDRWNASGTARMNGGGLDFGARPDDGGALVSINLDTVPYRVDYGLTARVSGLLSLRIPLPLEDASRMSLDGTMVVDRGVLVQDINLDREVFTLLTAPEATPGTEATFASRIDLDLNVTTRDGIRVRNNVADLRAHWGDLRVGGTAEQPEIRGRVDLDPGGLVYIYGQTARIDRGALIFTGNPVEDPVIDISTTSSLQDPSIADLRGSQAPLDILDRYEQDPLAEGPDMQAVLASGLAGYFGARVLSGLGESVGLSRLTVRPVLIFGEADPSARLTVGGDVSRNASFAFSVDLRNAERRTWLLDLHGFRGLPGLTLEAFTSDLDGEGGSLQQSLELGGSRQPEEEEGDRLRRLRLDVPEGISRRWALRRAIPLRRKAVVSEDAAFDIEVDFAQALRRRGYPDAQVTAEMVPVDDRPGWVDVNVSVPRLGPKVDFRFQGNNQGDKPPRAFRPEILATYRADFYEARSVDEMKAAAVRAFRSAGRVDPQVQVSVQRERPGDPEGPRTVTITSEAGRKARLDTLEIAGVDPEVSELAARRFPGKLSRAELAAALPDADRRLLDALGILGYPAAAIEGRELDRRGSKLTVRVVPGERRTFGPVEIAGVGEAERETLAGLLPEPVETGEPARWDLVLQGALKLQDSLRSRGYPDAEVRIAAPAPAPTPEDTVAVRYDVTPGERVILADVDFEGQRWSRPKQLEKAAGLKEGEPLNASEVAEARSRLYRAGIFSLVTADIDRTGDGEASVRFTVAESPRFHVGYGVRYENGEGTGAVVDALDSNFLGRGLTLGLRGLYKEDDRSVRLFFRTGGLFGTGISVETYGLVREQVFKDDILGDLQQDIDESSLQFSRPFGRRTSGRVYFRYRTTHLFELEPDPFSPFPFDIELKRPYMGTQVLFDSRNDKIDPTAGMFRSLDLSGSGPFLGSDFHYARLYGQWSLYETFRIGGRPIVWAQSVRTGLAEAFGGQTLIADDRFLAGGDFSVRGYETESLHTTGDPEKETLLVLNQELRFPLPFEDLTGLVFLDAGQVWDGLGSYDTDLAKGLGFGVRVRTPVGLLRFDAAFPLDRRPGDESYKLYFGFGNAF